jgi:redox-sensitive bicupin YhaK (pirin superfamily)
MERNIEMSDNNKGPIVQVKPLGFPWQTVDPFLFCVYHDDAYPKANGQMGPEASLAGRQIGQDFSRKDGWSMYHGDTVPGFVDHSDSLGATARFGGGDVQWLTAGKGIMHSEMFPLLDAGAPNPLELFQIWLNLPAKNKMAEPHFTMFWSDAIPRFASDDAKGGRTEVAVIAGRLGDAVNGQDPIQPLAPPPASWAAEADADVAIWTIKMTPGAQWTLPAAAGEGTRRMLYFFKGAVAQIAGERITGPVAVELRADTAVELVNGDDETSEFLVLQGRPIAEPVAQYGPFVMNTQAEISQTMADYRRTQFGGWPWDDSAPVHSREAARFARHPGGREEVPGA